MSWCGMILFFLLEVFCAGGWVLKVGGGEMGLGGRAGKGLGLRLLRMSRASLETV